MKRILSTIMAGVLLVGCATVDITKTSKGFEDPSDPNEIQILKTVPDRKYKELGDVTASGFSSRQTAKMHNAIRAKAAGLGADAVILTDEGLLPGAFATAAKWATGVAIKFED